jgi:hypothetical protein
LQQEARLAQAQPRTTQMAASLLLVEQQLLGHYLQHLEAVEVLKEQLILSLELEQEEAADFKETLALLHQQQAQQGSEVIPQIQLQFAIAQTEAELLVEELQPRQQTLLAEQEVDFCR